MNFFYSIVGFIFSIGVLVIFHEYGHFVVARFFNVKVTKFSIGFGPSKVLWKDRLGTEYLISAIPLGGYIKPLDTSDPDIDGAKVEEHLAINKKSPWVKICILLAGPLANIILAIILYWAVFLVGIPNFLPFIGTPSKGSIADVAQLRSGVQITKIAGKKVDNWEDLATNLMKQVVSNNSEIEIEIYDPRTKQNLHHILKVTNLIKDNKYHTGGELLKNIGIEPFKVVDQKIYKVIPEYPAFKAGIQAGDIIIGIDQTKINSNDDLTKYLKGQEGKKIELQIDRNGEILFFNLTPVVNQSTFFTKKSNKSAALIGVQYRSQPYSKEFMTIQKFGIIDSFTKAVTKTYDRVLLSGYLLYSTIIGNLSIKNAAGPVAIGYYAGQSIKSGIEYFLDFLAIVSVNLGILNLLPIPWLDGGSIVYYFYEALFKRSIPDRIVNFVKSLSLSLLIMLSIMVVINDIARL